MHDRTRLENGVKRRADGAGDAWAMAHRCLGTGHQMNDVDAIFGFEAFGANTGEKLFLEYEPDNYENRMEVIREHAVIALFDRKTTEGAAFGGNNRRSFSLYLHICRIIAASQAYPPRFFFCIGGQSPPWCLMEIDIKTGEHVKRRDTIIETTEPADWRRIWDALGLNELRLKLRSSLGRPPNNRQKDLFR
jgi:hypothetical protein